MQKRGEFKPVTLTKLANQIKGSHQLISTQFFYDTLDEVFEVALYDTLSISDGALEVPLRIYPIERQRAAVKIIGDIVSTEDVAFINGELGETESLEVIFSLDKPEVSYREMGTPGGKLHQLQVTKVIGDSKDVTLKFVFTFSENQVLNAHSLFAKGGDLSGSELAQYLYDTFMGVYDRTPKFVTVRDDVSEMRLYPGNRITAVNLVNDMLAITGNGEATLGISLEGAVGKVTAGGSDGYIISIEYPNKSNEMEVTIYV